MMQVGVTAMLIASKYEEIWAPELNDFVYISDRAYKKEQILTMEKVMLNALKFNLTGVCVHPRPSALASPCCTAAKLECVPRQTACDLPIQQLRLQFCFSQQRRACTAHACCILSHA